MMSGEAEQGCIRSQYDVWRGGAGLYPLSVWCLERWSRVVSTLDQSGKTFLQNISVKYGTGTHLTSSKARHPDLKHHIM